MSGELCFRFPMPPNIGNARMHWRTKDRERKAYFAALDGLQLTKQVPPPPAVPLVAPRIAVVMTLGNRMDHDNAMSRLKWPVDWLQSRGYLKNDRDLQWVALPAQVVSRAVPAGVEITLDTPTLIR